MASVSFEKATRRYPGAERAALDNLDLVIGDGEFMVLVGPSGCGKTTSLRMLAGLDTVDSGCIRIGDRDVTHSDPKDRDVAMVFQNYALYPHMTVAQNMGFALKIANACCTRRICSTWSCTWIASPKTSPAASASGWRWGGRSSSGRRCS